MEKPDQEELSGELAGHGALMAERFHLWLDGHGLSMRQFSADTGINYHRLMRISKNKQMGYDIVVTILKMDPLVSPRWLLGLEEQPAELYYQPSPVGELSNDAVRRRLQEAERVIVALQERVYQLLTKGKGRSGLGTMSKEETAMKLYEALQELSIQTDQEEKEKGARET